MRTLPLADLNSSIQGVRKNFRTIVISLGIIVLYFFTRTYNIMSLPIFTDEAIYTRWSQIARFDANWRFISLTDGKQPSFVWADMVVMRFVQDPLLAGRLVSVFAGFITLVGIALLTWELFKSRKAASLVALLYVLYPFSLVYDRMALYESLLTVFAVWALYFEVLLVRYRRLDVALILGMVLGGGLLTKSSASLFIYLLPFSLALFNLKDKGRVANFLKWLGLALVSVLMAYAFQSVMRLSPFFHIVAEKNTIFIYTFSEWREHPFRFLIGNIKGLFDWLRVYTAYPVLVLILLSLVVRLKFTREKLLLLIWFILPFFALALFGKVLYPRFVLFMAIFLLPLAAFSLDSILLAFKSYIVKSIVVLVFIALFIRTDFYIISDFARAPIPRSDLGQYINGWPAGGGVEEIVLYLKKEATHGKIYVASEGTFGSLPTYGVEIYLGDNKNVDKRGIWPVPEDIPADLVEKAKTTPVYFIFNQTQEPPPSWPLQFIAKYRKGKANSYMNLYRVSPQSR